MIDTLELSRSLEATGLPRAQAEAISKGIATSSDDSRFNKRFDGIDGQLAKLDPRFDKMDQQFVKLDQLANDMKWIKGVGTGAILFFGGLLLKLAFVP